MSDKRDLAGEVQAWIEREKARAAHCYSQIKYLTEQAERSEARAALLKELLATSGYADAPMEEPF